MSDENLSPMEQANNLTPQQKVDHTVRVARDSVWVINDEIQKKADRGVLTLEGRSNIERNVVHLETVMSDPELVELGGDLSDLTAAIANGKAALE
jgi:hypothetical protein